MNEKVTSRINELKAELEAGQKIMGELEQKRSNIVFTLLRINGALQVLEELIQEEEQPADIHNE